MGSLQIDIELLLELNFFFVKDESNQLKDEDFYFKMSNIMVQRCIKCII